MLNASSEYSSNGQFQARWNTNQNQIKTIATFILHGISSFESTFLQIF